MHEPRRTRPEKRVSKKQARQHSKFVRTTRLCLPIIVAGIFAAYGVTATPRTVDKNFLSQFQNIDDQGEDMRMENPRFLGEDTAGRAYEVNAQSAIQSPGTPDLVMLENPEAFRAIGQAAQAFVTAKSGLYDVKGKTMDLNTQVELQRGIGANQFILRTDAAEVVLEERVVHSKAPVYGESARGTLSAKGMSVYQEDGRTVFYDARMVIKPKRDKNKPALNSEAVPDTDKQKDEPET